MVVQLIILLKFLSLVKCSKFNFQRIDDNDDDSMAVGFTKVFHQCSLDSVCNYVVKKKKSSELEKLENIDDITNFYNVWKKLGANVKVSNVALHKPASMSSAFDHQSLASSVVDGNLFSSHAKCATTKRDNTSPWLLIDLLSEYHILYVRIKNINREFYRRSLPFDVRVGNSNQNAGISNGFCVQQGRIDTQDTIKRFDCPQGTNGRYVSFHTSPHTYLDLCELEAYGFKV